jgi:hypothetical protein
VQERKTHAKASLAGQLQTSAELNQISRLPWSLRIMTEAYKLTALPILFIMKAAYKITASPILFSEGHYKGELRGVAFSATSDSDKRQWLTINCGQFPRSFRDLIPDGSAEAMVAALVRGDSVELPGLHQEEEFAGGFTYIHNGTPVALDPSEFDGRPLLARSANN